MFVNKFFTYLTCTYLRKRCFNAKSSTYYFHMKTKIFTDFQVYLYRNFTPSPEPLTTRGQIHVLTYQNKALTLLKLINKRKIIPKLTTEERIFIVEKYIESNIINNIRQHFR